MAKSFRADDKFLERNICFTKNINEDRDLGKRAVK